MNERIKQLAKQAGFFPERNWDHTAWHAAGHNDTFEKFAELVVRECSQFVEDKFDFCGDELIIAEQILKHFGVEE